MRILKALLLIAGIQLLLAACSNDDSVTERTTTRSTPGTYSDSVTTERKTTVDD
jgi:hypothetical protein